VRLTALAVSAVLSSQLTTCHQLDETAFLCRFVSKHMLCTESLDCMCRGVGARALSNGINSAVFFCFFEALRATFAKKKEQVQVHPHRTPCFLSNQMYFSRILQIMPQGKIHLLHHLHTVVGQLACLYFINAEPALCTWECCLSVVLSGPAICSQLNFADVIQARRRAVTASRSRTGRPMLSTRQQAGLGADVKFGKTAQPATASLSYATGPALELS